MTAGIFGRKIGMTQIFDKDGSAIPVTLVKADPCQVCQIKTTKTDGYDAIQVGYLEEKLSKISKPIQGHLQKTLTGTGFCLRIIISTMRRIPIQMKSLASTIMAKLLVPRT